MFNGMQMKWYIDYHTMIQENVKADIITEEDGREMGCTFAIAYNEKFGQKIYQLFWAEDEGELMILVDNEWYYVCEGNMNVCFVPAHFNIDFE